MNALYSVFTVLFILVSAALVLIILVQRPQGGGLAGAFGGAGGGGTDTAFGGRTGDALTVATIAAFVVYLLLAIGLNITSNVMRNTPAPTPDAATATDSVPVTPATDTAVPVAPVTDAPATPTPVTDAPVAIPPIETPAPVDAPAAP